MQPLDQTASTSSEPLRGDAGYDYVEIPLAHAIRTKAIGAIAGAQTVPQVFINGRLIGGANELEAYLRKAA
jgi:peroxiredoxin